MNYNACLNCSDRTMSCHSTCEKYKLYKEHLAELKSAQQLDIKKSSSVRLKNHNM